LFLALTEFQSPADVADFDVLAEAFANGGDPLTLEVHNPAYDYIPPNLVSLFVTDTGGYTPSYVYRLLSEYYSREDYVLSKDLLNLMAR
jgi:translation initiation factor eIF-2B subunit beta